MPFVNASSAATGAGSDLLPGNWSGKVRSMAAEFTCASDAVGTYTVPIRIPRGARVLRCALNASVTMGGTATIALGIAGATGKYRAAATFTTTDQWVVFALNAATLAELTAEEQILMTVAAAALPASGRLLIMFEWMENS
jgi:hypothetical protein